MAYDFNILLDEKPILWQGYPINTDFRTGVQICQIMQDKELTDIEKYAVACELLFPGVMPEAEEVARAIDWYMNGWMTDKPSQKKDKVRLIDFDVDQGRIYSAFRAQYRLDLNTVDLHYWEFMWLLTNLEECAFTRVIDIRNKTANKRMSAEEKKALKAAKEIYALEPLEEKESVREKEIREEAATAFLERIKGK